MEITISSEIGTVILAVVAFLTLLVNTFVTMQTRNSTAKIATSIDGQHTALVEAGIVKDATIASQATALGQTPTEALQSTPGVPLTPMGARGEPYDPPPAARPPA